MKNQHVKDAIDKVVEVLRTGDIKRIAYAVFKSQRDRPSDSWSFFNRLIMFASGTEDARGFRQWQRTGRYILKGTKAFYILGPVKYKTRKKVTNEDGEEEVLKEEIQTGFKAIPVYRVEDTTGASLEEDDFKLEIPANLSQVAEGFGLRILAKRFTGDTYGYFSAVRKEIALMSPELNVYLHELAHAVDNELNGELQGGQQPDQEIVAELSAEVVGYLLGHRLNRISRDYITDYSGGSWKPVFALLNRVNSVVQYIVEKAQIEEGGTSSSIDFIRAA